jgi:hypothetical protein
LVTVWAFFLKLGHFFNHSASVVLIGLATTCAFYKKLAVLKLFCHHGFHWFGKCLGHFLNHLATMVSNGLTNVWPFLKKWAIF